MYKLSWGLWCWPHTQQMTATVAGIFNVWFLLEDEDPILTTQVQRQAQ